MDTFTRQNYVTARDLNPLSGFAPVRQLMKYVVAAVLCVLLGASVHAAEKQPSLKDLARPPAGSSFAPAPGISLERATSIARKHTGGRVLSATPKQRSNGVEYRVRMLVDGERVMTVVVDNKGRIKNKR